MVNGWTKKGLTVSKNKKAIMGRFEKKNKVLTISTRDYKQNKHDVFLNNRRIRVLTTVGQSIKYLNSFMKAN